MTATTTGVRARWFYIMLWLIVMLAFGLRLYALDRQDIWGDEAISIRLSSEPLPRMLIGADEAHPPLYRLLLYLWLPLVGSSPGASRLFSAVIGTLIVPVVAILAQRIWGAIQVPPGQKLERQWGTALAALLAAVSPVLVYYSQETRMYALVTLLAALSVYFALRVLRDGRNAHLLYFLATQAAVYSHYYAFLVVLAQNLVILPALLRDRRGSALKRWLLAQMALVLLYIPWLVVKSSFLGSKAGDRFAGWDRSIALGIVEQTLRTFAAGLAVPTAAAWGIAALFLLAVAVGLLSLLRQRQAESWMIIAWFFVPLILATFISPILSLPYARYLLIIAPAFLLMATQGVIALSRFWKPLGIALALALLVASGYGLYRYYTDEEYVRGRYGQMMAYVEANAQPGDGLILANQLQRPIFEYYQPKGLDAYFFPRREYSLEDPRTAAELQALAERHPRLWLVRFGNPAEYDPAGTLTRWLATHGSKAYFDGWVDADLSLYVMTPAAADVGDISHPLQVNLDDKVQLLGYALSAEQITPGETLLLTLYWQALSPMDERYTVFTHLLDAENQIQAQMDSEPQGGGLPTDRWAVGQIVQDNYALVVSEEAAPGEHVLEVGMYLLETLERLPIRDPDTGESLGDRALLGTVEVVAP